MKTNTLSVLVPIVLYQCSYKIGNKLKRAVVCTGVLLIEETRVYSTEINEATLGC